MEKDEKSFICKKGRQSESRRIENIAKSDNDSEYDLRTEIR